MGKTRQNTCSVTCDVCIWGLFVHEHMRLCIFFNMRSIFIQQLNSSSVGFAQILPVYYSLYKLVPTVLRTRFKLKNKNNFYILL
jgi:hypothetical protein